ncbi:MAG: hypothetical protein QN193_07430 [Armatimonadota bacterium]|nr:hypothetical protein [Armatimonadota bacterium]MDR7443920.1 hypothetical protein [Armatimonadota bacterium]MDR7570422.1 hypothetical protein [Armatimonadota bacterium]MDR7613221.1 hypothetical protein [Armatimonadota bacterium]
MNRSLRLVALGLGILLASWSLLFLTTLRLIPQNLLLSLSAYAASLAGLFLGLVGLAEYLRTHRLP